MFFYREILLSGFDTVFGDDGDARLAMLLMEHWFRVWSGKAAFFSPIFFYPAPDVIGFTDANFLYGIVYSLGRGVGLTTYGAFQLVVMAWGVIGYMSMFWLLRSALRLHLAVCVLSASLFAFSNLNAIQVGHMQLLTVATVPLLIGWSLRIAARWQRDGKVDTAAGSAIAILYPLMAFTGFYVCWYLALFATTAAFVASAGMIVSGRARSLLDLVATARANTWRILALGLVAGAASLPFITAYGPQLLHNNGFTVDPLFLSSFPHPRDLINVGGDNLIWGRLITWLIPDLYGRLGAYELLMGVPIGFALVFLASTLAALTLPVRGRGVFPAVVAISIWIGLASIVNLRGYSVWWIVRRIVPGAGSIRVVSRYEVLLYAMALIASAIVASRLLQHRPGPVRPWQAALLLLIGAFLLSEQVQPTFARVSKSADLTRLLSVPAPPDTCRFFLLAPAQEDVAAAPDPAAFIRRAQVDAIYQAMRFGLPTVNGLSSLNPTGYFFYDLGSAYYQTQAGMWLARYDLLQGACTLDLKSKSWALVSADASPLPATLNLLDPPEKGRTLASGMRYGVSGLAGGLPRVWSGASSQWIFPTPQNSGAVTIRFYVANKSGSDVTLLINGTTVSHNRYGAGSTGDLTIKVEQPIRSIGIQSNTFKPSSDGISTDNRDLGVLMTWLSLGS